IGNLKYVNDFYLEIQLDSSQNNTHFSNRVIHLPLYSLIHLEDIKGIKSSLKQESRVNVIGLQKDDTIVPVTLTVRNSNLDLRNKQLWERIYTKKDATEPLLKEISRMYLTGSIKKVHVPESVVGMNAVYENHVLIDRIKQFQFDLIVNQKYNTLSSIKIMDYEENDIKYKILIKTTKDATGKINYIFAMTSLQPVDEAVQMIQDYYVYLIIFVLFLIALLSFYYSKKIAKPLLQINDTTKKMADLDFSETIPIKTKDEIG
ncbi:HAMP domain-containing protein, partial [Bacillus cereus]|uniref:HAMP domain-containing protein n=1 Tax=Bacillus cereus TaxID=1396 RepID=UPI001156041A